MNMRSVSGGRWGAWTITVALTACEAPLQNELEVCTLDLVLTPVSAQVGEVVTATGGPLTEAGPRDHLVLVGGLPAEVRAVTRSDACTNPLEGCDVCRAEALCPPCGFCPLDIAAAEAMGSERRTACFGDPLADPVIEGVCDLCEETLTFVVPDGLPPGPTSVVVFNGNGQSSTLTLEVVAKKTGTKTTPVTTP